MGIISLISKNVKYVIEIEELILLFQYQTLNSSKLTLLYKTLTVARLVIANKKIF